MRRAMRQTVHMLHDLSEYLHSLLRKLHKSEENMHRLSSVIRPDAPHKVPTLLMPLKPALTAALE